MKHAAFVCASVLALALFAGCYEPSPLYGVWSDNDGNSITFVSDGTFLAAIKESAATEAVTYQGDYTVMENTVTFSYMALSPNGEDLSLTKNTEWDLRGSMLYIQWWLMNDSGNPQIKQLTLYHTAK